MEKRKLERILRICDNTLSLILLQAEPSGAVIMSSLHFPRFLTK